MIIAGSLLVLLLLRLAVDGFINPIKEEDLSHHPTDGNGPRDARFSEDVEDAADQSDEEDRADTAWLQTEETTEPPAFLEVEATTKIAGVKDIAYVDNFAPETDTLVLEFDGLPQNAPKIDVYYDARDNAAIIMANGVPVTMVVGAEGMTPAHVRIVMGGDETALKPQVIPDAESLGNLERAADTTGPQIDPPVEEAQAKRGPGPDLSQTQVTNLEHDAPEDGPKTTDQPLPDNRPINAFAEQIQDDLPGADGNATLSGGGNRDLLFGLEGDGVLSGSAVKDFLQGWDGSDTLDGGSRDDHILLGQGDPANGSTGADTFTAGSRIENADFSGRVEDFNPGEDRIEVIFDPQKNPYPTLEVMDFADGSGADILLNGEVILSVPGAQGLDPNVIDLQAVH